MIWRFSGKLVLEERLAASCMIDPSALPYNSQVVQWLTAQKAEGRQITLATSGSKPVAELVAAHLGLFDDVLAINADPSAARSKRDALISSFGERGFDYLGSNRLDLPVWKIADKAYVVRTSSRLISQVKALGNLDEVIDTVRPALGRPVLDALRPHQWFKNLLVFVPLLTAHQYGNATSVLRSLLAFVVFGMVASSLYLLNDLIDVNHDRRHHSKRERPFAAGTLSLSCGWLLFPVLVLLAFTLASHALPPAFLTWLATYFILALTYSLWLKQKVIVDVLSLTGLYELRIVAGAAAIGVPLSFWLLVFSLFIFLSLAFVKRFSELKATSSISHGGTVAGRGYVKDDLEIVLILGVASGFLSVLVLAFYIADVHTSELYSEPHLIWLACPLLLYWISRVWMIAHRGMALEDPISFALGDTTSWIVGASMIAVLLAARFMP